MALRLVFALQFAHYTIADWARILWTDETWMSYGHYRKVFVTRKPGEELDPTCIKEREQRQAGWMFWACFSGIGKGPRVFWEKEWGTITTESYQQHIVPVIHG